MADSLLNLHSFITCRKCGRRFFRRRWIENYHVCPVCGAYRAMTARDRIASVFDRHSVSELDSDITASDPISFPGYAEKVNEQRRKNGLNEAVMCVTGKIGGIKVACAVLDSNFMMGSMSSGVGEKITRTVEYADQNSLPLVIFSASGGARMQEGIFSLMQMAKTSAAIQSFSENGGLYISVLTHPTTGGVTASFATLGDMTLAEPNALIGFAGPRVIEQTINEKLPKGFQRSEYLFEHGFVDRVVERKDLRNELIRIMKMYGAGIKAPRKDSNDGTYSITEAGKSQKHRKTAY